MKNSNYMRLSYPIKARSVTTITTKNVHITLLKGMLKVNKFSSFFSILIDVKIQRNIFICLMTIVMMMMMMLYIVL